MPVFEFRTELPCSQQGLFEFMARPKNISRVSDPALGIVFPDPPEVLSEETEIEFQIASFGQVHTITHRISKFAKPDLVIEEQISGPMESWTHQHVYESSENGCVKLDVVEFETPGGLVGFFLTPAKVSDQLEEGMCVREEKLKQLIEQGEIE